MSFSQRMGLEPTTRAIQVDDIDARLRGALWNVLTLSFWENYRHGYDTAKLRYSNFSDFAKHYAFHHDISIDRLPEYWDGLLETIRRRFEQSPWNKVYDFLEYMAISGPEEQRGSREWRDAFISFTNAVLESHNSGYRFIEQKIAPITSSDELEEIENAISNSQPYAGVKQHIQTALGLLTNRDAPDYRNSIKESISAVESLARHITGDQKASLGEALKVLETKHHLEPTVKQAFLKLYGYTSDGNGIRHSLMRDDATPTKADARFMLICCSAFVNFAIDSCER